MSSRDVLASLVKMLLRNNQNDVIISMYYRDLLAYVYFPVAQKELVIFRECVWNSHRCRKQNAKELPAGILEYIYNFPDKYGVNKCGLPITLEQLEVAEVSDILANQFDFFPPAVKQECQQHLPDVSQLEPKHTDMAYLYLRSHVNRSAFSEM